MELPNKFLQLVVARIILPQPKQTGSVHVLSSWLKLEGTFEAILPLYVVTMTKPA